MNKFIQYLKNRPSKSKETGIKKKSKRNDNNTSSDVAEKIHEEKIKSDRREILEESGKETGIKKKTKRNDNNTSSDVAEKIHEEKIKSDRREILEESGPKPSDTMHLKVKSKKGRRKKEQVAPLAPESTVDKSLIGLPNSTNDASIVSNINEKMAETELKNLIADDHSLSVDGKHDKLKQHESPIIRHLESDTIMSSCNGVEETTATDVSAVEQDGLSVACLQDKLLEMEETHHSTNEELQATLQELADLQNQHTDLQSELQRMDEEKNVLLESLCRQTEKLEDARIKVDTLQELLLTEQGDACSEREQKLVDLLKCGQEERECLLLKIGELTSQVTELRKSATSDERQTTRLEERITILESGHDALKAEKKQIETELTASKEEASSLAIEINRLNTLLDHAKTKICELEQARELKDKSELEAVIDLSRKEKDLLEVKVAELQDQLSRSVCERLKLTEQIQQLAEELKVSRNNAKCAISDINYQVEQANSMRNKASQELQESRELVKELQVQVTCLMEDKEELKSVLSETQKSYSSSERKMRELERCLSEETKSNILKNEEWEQFQSDLLTTVRVAHNLKVEAQTQLEQLLQENETLKNKMKALDSQIEKFKAKAPTPPTLSETSASVLRSVEQDLAFRRNKAAAGKPDPRLSVKSLIESIENATKQAKAGPGSRSSSATSVSSMNSEIHLSTAPFTRHYSESDVYLPAANKFSGGSLGKDTKSGSMNRREFERGSSCGDISDKDPLQRLAKHGGSKRNGLLNWCQTRTSTYNNVDITNFSTSWSDGLALCALLHSLIPGQINYGDLTAADARKNFFIAFAAAESVGIPTTLDIEEMLQAERPDWQHVFSYITSIYRHFEGCV